MAENEKSRKYREIIDALVKVCKNGQGRIGAERARKGVWNRNATQDLIPDQHKINLLLQRLSPSDRETLAGMLSHQAEVGVFETLKILEQFRIEPFTDGYEGSPYHDFIGRMADWEWPKTNH